MALRMVIMGTSSFAVPLLTSMQQEGHEILAVYSQPPRPAGRRGLQLVKTPLHQAAETLAIPVFTPETLRGDQELERLRRWAPDVILVAAYGLLLPAAWLEIPHYGCLNIHASLLPRWRGAAPVQRALMAGDLETGVAIMRMEKGLDTGPVAKIKRIRIGLQTTAALLQDQLSVIGAQLMAETLLELEQDRLHFVPQATEGVTYAHKLSKEETRIQWNQSGWLVHRHIASLSPMPGAWCEMIIAGKKERVKILETVFIAQKDVSKIYSGGTHSAGYFDSETLTMFCQEDAVRLVQLQRAGGKVLSGQQFMRGATVTAIL